MQPSEPPSHNLRLGFIIALLVVGAAALFFAKSRKPDAASDAAIPAAKQEAAKASEDPSTPAVTNAPPPSPGTAATQTAASSAPEQPGAVSPDKVPPTARGETASKTEDEKTDSADDVQVSFQGANIDMVVQWMAKTTGKSVVKHPRVQCQLTIVSSKKVPVREALTLVYRALSLEGFTAIESSNSILIVPDGQEPRMSPEMVGGSQSEVPQGRQRLLKVFPLQYIQAGDLKDKVRAVLSEKATIESDERANQIIVTDYNDNIRLLSELIKELDITAIGDSVIEIYPLKYAEAEELATLLGLVLNAQSAPSGSSGHPSRSSSSPSSSSSSGPPAAGAAGQQVRLWADKTANRLIVTAPRSKIPEVEKLIDLLDTQKPEDVAVRVLPLKHVSADDLVKEIGPLYQKMSGRSQKDMIEITANNRSNSLIILSGEANYTAIENLVHTLDTDEAQEKIMQAFPLTNADAEDVATQLQELQKDQDSSPSSRIFFYSPYNQRASTKKINVVADRRRNTVIVQAPPAAMAGIAQMIEELDEPVTDDGLAPKIFQLKYISAQDVEDVLNELFLKKQQPQRSYWDYYSDFGRGTTERDVGRLYGKVRITSEPYSNSLIVTANSRESLAAVEEVLHQLDVPSQAGETTLRVELKFAQAVTVASSLNILFARAGSPPLRAPPQPPQSGDNRNQQQQGVSGQRGFELEQEAKEDAYFSWLGGQQDNVRGTDRTAIRPVSDLVGRVRVVPDRRSNSLLITANVHFFPQVIKLITELDAPTVQVLIEARIIEVASDFRERLGVRWSPDGTQVFEAEDFDNSLMPSASAGVRDVFLGTTVANSLRTGILDANINLDFLIQFLRKNTASTVLAEPKISVSDNELGRLFVGSQVPFISNSLVTQEGRRNDSFQYKDVGIILEVTPHINNSDEIALRIRAESSNIRAGQTLFGGAILDTRNFRTDLLVKSGQTIVLGGIIQREEVDTVRKVPLLGDIPGLGWAFKKKDKTSREVELMVFLRPVITRTPEEAQSLVEEMEKRAPRLMEKKNGAALN